MSLIYGEEHGPFHGRRRHGRRSPAMPVTTLEDAVDRAARAREGAHSPCHAGIERELRDARAFGRVPRPHPLTAIAVRPTPATAPTAASAARTENRSARRLSRRHRG